MSVMPDYQPYLAGPFRWRLGLRPLDLAEWILIGPDAAHDLRAKADLLSRHPDTVLAVPPDIEPEAAEVRDALVDHLCERFPDLYARDVDPDGVGVVVCHLTDERHRLTGDAARHPLDTAGRLVQEDLVLLVERDGRLVCGGDSVCFPNRWDLRSKVGRTMAEVHAPVAQLNEQLQDPIDGFLARLRPGREMWRLGWGVLDTDEHYQPLDGTAPPRPPLPTSVEAAGEHLFLRVERETLRRFPRTGCVLFTIRTHLRPLAHLAERPEDAGRLAAALRALPADVADYKQVRELSPVALAWLDVVAGGAGTT